MLGRLPVGGPWDRQEDILSSDLLLLSSNSSNTNLPNDNHLTVIDRLRSIPVHPVDLRLRSNHTNNNNNNSSSSKDPSPLQPPARSNMDRLRLSSTAGRLLQATTADHLKGNQDTTADHNLNSPTIPHLLNISLRPSSTSISLNNDTRVCRPAVDQGVKVDMAEVRVDMEGRARSGRPTLFRLRLSSGTSLSRPRCPLLKRKTQNSGICQYTMSGALQARVSAHDDQIQPI
jgi:hypothetical protein